MKAVWTERRSRGGGGSSIQGRFVQGLAVLAVASVVVAPMADAAPRPLADDPVAGRWWAQGQDTRGPWEGTLSFTRLAAGRYHAEARIRTTADDVDRSYQAPATLADGRLIIWRRRAVSDIPVEVSPHLPTLGINEVLRSAIDGLTATVSARALNLRAGPGASQPILGVVRQDEQLDLLESPGAGWLRVRTSTDRVGWVSARWVRVDLPAAPPSEPGPHDWVGVFEADGPHGWDGTWRRDGQEIGTESLVRIAEGPLSFACVDLTVDRDSRDFSYRFKRSFRWSNLIAKVPGGIDAAHPTMSLQGGIVSPYGRVEATAPHVEVSRLDPDVGKANIATVNAWLPRAGVRVSADGRRGQLLGDGPMQVDGEIHYADFLFVSGHGYPSGKVKFVPSFEPPVEEEDEEGGIDSRRGRRSWFDATILNVKDLARGRRWRNDRTRWVMLALCNVLRREHWQAWASALAEREGLRGVLGYFRAAPGPSGTTVINKRFFEASKRGMSILEAWKYANKENPRREGPLTWCAIVREDAVSDSLADWTRRGELPESGSGGRVLYFSTLPDEKDGVELEADVGAEARIRVKWSSGGQEVTPETVSRGGGLVPGHEYALGLEGLPRDLEANDRVHITFVNIRENYWTGHGEFDLSEMFELAPGAVVNRRRVHQPSQPDTLVLPGHRPLVLKVREGMLDQVSANEAEIWVKIEVVDQTGRVIGRGSSIDHPLIARAPSVASEPDSVPVDESRLAVESEVTIDGAEETLVTPESALPRD